MPDNPPISTTVPETVSVDLGVNKEQLGSLDSDFKDFWDEQDSKSDLIKEPKKEEPPPAPAQETTKSIVEDRPAKEPPEIDIEKLELEPGEFKPSQEHVAQFKKIKDFWIADKKRAEELRKEVDKLSAELTDAKNNAWTPETKADYEHASQIRRQFDYITDPEFQKKYQEPVRNQFDKILNQAIDFLADRNAAIRWVNEDIKAKNYGPDSLNRDWWFNSVVAHVPNPENRRTLGNSVDKLLDLQKERDAEIYRNTNDKSSYDNFISQRDALTNERTQQEIMAEIEVQKPRFADFLPVDVSKSKTSDERAAMEAHNERFNKLNSAFMDQIKDLAQNGPRAWVRAAATKSQTMIMNDQIINLEKEVKELKSERDKYKTELEKITGARRRLAQSSGSQPSAEVKKNGQALSLKDLADPRKSMEDFWAEQDRKGQ
jgi:hypothetical protein